jgi:hypothetical protein
MPDNDLNWADTSRVEAWAGELRVNLVRMIALVIFYARHLIEYWLGGSGSPFRGVYHARVTWIVIAWAVMAIIMHLRLSRRHYHDWTKYLAVGWDCVMVVALCAIAGGPKTSLVLLLFPIVASAALRLSLKLVYFATACAMSAYLILLGMYVWYVVGFHKYYATPELRIPRRDEAIVLLSLLVTGLFAGQTVRQMKRLAQRAEVAIAPVTTEGA